MMQRNGFSLSKRALLCQKLPADFKQKLVALQQHVNRTSEKEQLPPEPNGKCWYATVF